MIDPDRPEKGISFDGRVTEDFKLTTGTWVSVGTLRTALVSSFTPYAQDFVVCGHNENYVAVLMFPTPAIKALVGSMADALPPHRWIEVQAVKEKLSELMEQFKTENPGTSQHIRALTILDNPPNMAAGEITDKGNLNQRSCLENHQDKVAEFFHGNKQSVLKI